MTEGVYDIESGEQIDPNAVLTPEEVAEFAAKLQPTLDTINTMIDPA